MYGLYHQIFLSNCLSKILWPTYTTKKKYSYWIFLSYYVFYSSSGASTGQTPAQVPQLIQADWSITNLSSPWEIHPTGHSAAQPPPEIH